MFDRRWKPPVVVYQKLPHECMMATACACHEVLKELEELRASYRELLTKVQVIEGRSYLPRKQMTGADK